MPVHDRITAAFDKARPRLADAFHADNYMIVRSVRVPDGSGGSTNVEAVVESGKCALSATGRIGTEGSAGSLTLSISNYEVEMPKTTTLTASDVMYVNSRKFDVISVNKGGDHDIFPMANVEEAS